MKVFKNFFVQTKSLILIFFVTAVIVISSSLIELNQSKSEMLELMEKQGHSLLETLLASSNIALLSYEKIENELKQKLLSNAVMIRMMYENGLVNNSLLENITKNNQIYRINIFDRNGIKRFTSHREIHSDLPEKENPIKYIEPILNGEADTLIIGIKSARFQEGQRFAVAVSTKDGGAIVLNVDAEDLLKFRKQVGFGILLKKVTENSQIVYAALQDEKGIIAGSGEVQNLEAIDSSEVLKKTLSENSYKWRIAKIGSLEVFEALHPFVYNNKTIGIFRLGISMEPLNKINERLTRRVIFIGIVLFIFGFVTMTLIFVRQNFDLLSKRFTAIESYSSRIIDNVSDGIIVLDSSKKIQTINKAGEILLGIDEGKSKGKEFFSFFAGSKCEKILHSTSSIEEIECNIAGKEKVFLVSMSDFYDENKENRTILVLRDLTELKLLEKQIERSERLVAMGELASSVAHEIRNPLNSIGTIAQQLGKDFAPKENEDEFKSLTQVVYKEVRRINETIESFLKFAKPQPINATDFFINELFDQLEKQYQPLLAQKKIKLNISLGYDGSVLWDKTQMTQVFINLFENSIDAVAEKGEINIDVTELKNNQVEIKFADNGKGISSDDLKRIFNLYFTTKSKGSGIGLSIVQKIISEHNGLLSVQSEQKNGTVFTIVLPKYYS
ncbi:MAG: ATP-binding protein [Ignavibacteriales bacterium]|nr:ATP-binding protein [Ignavibacteriales bacterium]